MPSHAGRSGSGFGGTTTSKDSSSQDTAMLELAKSTLDCDAEDVPDFYIPILRKFMNAHPDDTNFIVERDDPKLRSMNGDGFGTVTCMEDHCWKDVILGPDSSEPEGGKKRGFGTFANYGTHCLERSHKEGRDERLKKAGKKPTPLGSFSSSGPLEPMKYENLPNVKRESGLPSSQSSQAGPSRFAFSSDKFANLALDPVSIDLTDWDTGSDSDVQVLAENEIPSEYKKVTNRDNPFTLDSDDDDDDDNIIVQPKGQSSQHVTSSQAGRVPSSSQSSIGRSKTSSILNPKDRLTAHETSRKLGSNNNLVTDPIYKKINQLKSVDKVAVLKFEKQWLENIEPHITQCHRELGKDLGKRQDELRAFLTLDGFLTIKPPKNLLKNGCERMYRFYASLHIELQRALIVPSTFLLDTADLPSVAQAIRDVPPSCGRTSAAASIGTIAPPIASTPASTSTPPTAQLDMSVVTLSRCISLAIGKHREAMKRPGTTALKRQRAAAVASDFIQAMKQAAPYKLHEIDDPRIPRSLRYHVDIIASVRELKPNSTGPTAPPAPAVKTELATAPRSGPVLDSKPTVPQAGGGTQTALLDQKPTGAAPLSTLESERNHRYKLGCLMYDPYVKMVAENLGCTVGTIPRGVLETYPAYSSIANLPAAGQSGMSQMPGAYGAVGAAMNDDDDDRYEVEWDRPQTGEGYSELFKTALDDFQEDVDVETALKGLGLNRLEDSLDGLKCRLMPHQVIGVHWMLQQEQKPSYAGGILGDDMGLGKTVQTIATMVKNRSQDAKFKSTLIVLPLALMSQWKAEIECKSDLTVTTYHGPNRTKSVKELQAFDCVLTTYNILVSEGQDLLESGKGKKFTKDDFVDDDGTSAPKKKKTGPLFKIPWFRVILDEAAIIRNRVTKASRVVLELSAEIKWCLTGTLIYNALADIFPLLRFIGIMDWEEFGAKIARKEKKAPRLAARRSQAILRKCMLRRTKDSELHGKKILQLPPKTVDIVELEFTDEERAIYQAIEAAARVKVNRWFEAGTLLKNYHVVLVMLTRLRQLCCHPWLLRASEEQAHINAIPVDEDYDPERQSDLPGGDLPKAIRLLGQEWVDKVGTKLRERHQKMLKGSGNGKGKEPENDEDENDYSCAICLEPYEDERITSCQHSFCKQCIDDVLNAPVAPGGNMTDEQIERQARLCPLCRHEITKDSVFRAEAFFDPKAEMEEDDDEDSKPGSSVLEQALAANIKKRASGWLDPSVDDLPMKKIKSDGLIAGMGKGKGRANDDDDEMDIEDVLPSTKMKRIGELIDYWSEVDPTQKTLIFSSFVEMLELMAVYLRKRGVKYVLYTGKLKPLEREDAIKRFIAQGVDTPTVMLISLKCGGVGLNLTAANNVIGLDLAWSPASESQAVDRAHRIGQTRPVSVKRLIINNSVEERIFELQQKKQALADGAMGEGAGGRLGRMTAQELVNLFGRDDHGDD